MKKISCIIPAYNEVENIGTILAVAVPLIGTVLHEVIIVDDYSRDATKDIVRKFPKVQLIEHSKNTGKSRAVADGIKASSGDYIFLLDADLQFLNAQNIIDLIAPIESGAADFSISYRKNAWPLFPFKKIDFLSGERILPKESLTPALATMEKLPGYGLEVFLNRIITRDRMRISVVQWPNVENVFKFEPGKHGRLKGSLMVLKIWRDVLSEASIIEVYSQNFRMLKLLVR